jgi:hypothetical protein
VNWTAGEENAGRAAGHAPLTTPTNSHAHQAPPPRKSPPRTAQPSKQCHPWAGLSSEAPPLGSTAHSAAPPQLPCKASARIPASCVPWRPSAGVRPRMLQLGTCGSPFPDVPDSDISPPEACTCVPAPQNRRLAGSA